MSRGDSLSNDFEVFLMEHGIESTPQDIGLEECVNQTFVIMTKCMLEVQKLKKSLWAKVVANVVYTLNRCLTRALQYVSPEVSWSSKRPYIAHMRLFRSIAYVMDPDEKRGKLVVKGMKCVFLGHCEGMKAYRLMHLETHKIFKKIYRCCMYWR